MVFKKLLGAFGVGGPSVDTVLANSNTRPGLTLDGQIHILGGDHDVKIDQVSLGLVTRVEVESGDSNYDANVEFHRIAVAGAFPLAKGERKDIPFSFPVPWEAPVTDVYGQRLRGMTMGLRTELAVARAVDKGDLDPVQVHPLPAQERILDAFNQLGFRFKGADLERGRVYGVNQQLPFYQEIEFYPPSQYAGGINECELTFVADPQGVEVILEFDKRGGFLSSGHDAYGRFRVDHATVDQTDWVTVVDGWVRSASDRYSSLRASHGYHGGGHHGGHGRGGLGAGAVIAGAGAGILGGMVLGEAMEEVFEGGDDFGDFGE
ncbi:sporulation protein [Phytohabitans flavus]|uniref:Sporulation protein n=1 Tax=Phytohabitans flavus TaxID=1076124 RepID=A0A6F8Y8L1_9ACTN|nr:sporulation protein [Phytohabitans flavus]BCB82369.1 sporulation protein [Phytohabitans flavus]